ncbi:hypothetical protein PR202_ga25630 [Eleusine coracana subsp. coracana]|uniref:NAC domain-containing protein n=1 Tax=Eleusine coracana subsp. coracana TaxID=191504 RepID=A0AAV5DC25_ELECO|nr:hypothetical protein PR202_ga25630 [Eleusine coracana subsp. coracana]
METPPPPAASSSFSSSSSSSAVTSGSAHGSNSSPVASDGGDNAASAALIRQRFSLNLPPGFRFVPTDAELIVHFLRPKLAGEVLPLPIFFDERILDYHPEQLVEKYREHGQNRWFFFTRRERKHAGGKRPNRTTPGNGHWNADGEIVGCVGTLVFYEASRKKKKEDIVAAVTAAAETTAASPDEDSGKTDWTMYEYESLTSKAEFDAKTNGEGRIDELVLCSIQKKKHCEQSKEGEVVKGNKKKRKKEDQESTPSAGNSEKKRTCVKAKDQESSHVGGNGGREKKSTQVGRKNEQKGSPAEQEDYFVKRSLMAQEEETYLVKRSLMETPQHEPVQAPPGAEVDPNMDMLHCSVTALTQPTMSYLNMMLLPDAGTQSNIHPNYVTLHNFIQPMEFPMMLQGQEHYFAYEQPNMQHMQLNTMALPEVYGPGLGPEYPSYGYGNGDHLHGTNMDHHELSSFQFPPQPSDGVEGSTSTQGTVMPL